MRIAVLSDIHSNFVALEAVLADVAAQGADAIIVAGDFLNRGPQPREVREFLRAQSWPMLRGNHEDYVVAQCQNFSDDDALANPIWQPARWTATQIDRDASGFAHLPISTRIQTPGGDIVIAHGTTRFNNEGIFPKTSDAELREIITAASDENSALPLYCCGHTHVSLVRQIGHTLVVNAGAVGMPFNGDTRAQYAIVTRRANGWDAELRAVEYDVERAAHTFQTHGFLDGGGPLARVILHELRSARPHLSHWINRFGDAVRAGEMSVARAVELYLAAPETYNPIHAPKT
jgi:putative phosphoesterase